MVSSIFVAFGYKYSNKIIFLNGQKRAEQIPKEKDDKYCYITYAGCVKKSIKNDSF